jgi:hypothetical protein
MLPVCHLAANGLEDLGRLLGLLVRRSPSTRVSRARVATAAFARVISLAAA